MSRYIFTYNKELELNYCIWDVLYTCWHAIKGSSWWFIGAVGNGAGGDGSGEMMIV